MNALFTELVKDGTSIKPFLEWYQMRYNTIVLFQNLPFSHQIGVYLEYFESMYNLVVLVNTKGFTVHFTDQRKTPLTHDNDFNYYHHKYEYEEPKSIIYGYQLGIIWLFKNYDLPF